MTHSICRAAQNRPKQAECVPIWGFVTYVTFGVAAQRPASEKMEQAEATVAKSVWNSVRLAGSRLLRSFALVRLSLFI